MNKSPRPSTSKNLKLHEENQHSLENNLEGNDLDDIPVFWDCDQIEEARKPIRETNLLRSYQGAIATINKAVPAPYRTQVIDLVSTMYHAGTSYTFIMEIQDSFKDADHWIMQKYTRLMKKQEAKTFLFDMYLKNKYVLQPQVDSGFDQTSLLLSLICVEVGFG